MCKTKFTGKARQRVGTITSTTRVSPISKCESSGLGNSCNSGTRSEFRSAGEIRALVTENVYDTAIGEYLLIPQGSRSIGAPWSTAPRQGERIMSVTNCGQNSRMNALWSVGSEYLEFAFEETLRNLFRFFTEPCRIFRGAVKYGCGLEGLESSVGSD
jgi:hypothetical protein